MRRVLSIVLALAFGLEPVAFAIGFDDGASLPACCRRHGAHHCAMSSQQDSAGERTSSFTAAHCPQFPPHQSASPTSMSAIVRWPITAPSDVQTTPIGIVIESANGAKNLCTFTLRGPPTHLSA